MGDGRGKHSNSGPVVLTAKRDNFKTTKKQGVDRMALDQSVTALVFLDSYFQSCLFARMLCI